MTTKCILYQCSKNISAVLILLLTNTIEQSPSWETNRMSASREIHCTLWNPKVHYPFTTASHLSLTWARSTPSIPQHPTSWRTILLLFSDLSLGVPSGLFPSGFPKIPCIRLSSPQNALYVTPNSFYSILATEQYWVRSTDHSAPHYVVSSTTQLSPPS